MEIKYQLNEKDYERLAVQTVKSNISSTIIYFRITTPLLIMIGPLGMDYLKHKVIVLNIPDMVSRLLIGILVVIFVEQILYWHLRRKGRKFARGNEPKVFKEFDEIKVVLTDYNKLSVVWDRNVFRLTEPFYLGVRETRDLLVYDGGEEKTLIVPKRVFNSEQQQTKFKDMMSKFIREDN